MIRRFILSLFRSGEGRPFQRGFNFLEVLVAVSIFAVLTVVLINAIDTASRNTDIIVEHTTARNLAATFIETIRNANYASDYTILTDGIPLPLQYDAEVDLDYSMDGGDTWTANYSDTALQRITINVMRGNRLVLSFCDYKMKL